MKYQCWYHLPGMTFAGNLYDIEEPTRESAIQAWRSWLGSVTPTDEELDSFECWGFEKQ